MLPGAFDHACQGTLAYWKLANDGAIAQQDYAGNNIRLLLAVTLPQYHIFDRQGRSRKPPTSPA